MPSTGSRTKKTQKRTEPLRPHPTRDEIIDVMAAYGRPISPTRVAEITGKTIGSVAYHVRTLAGAGAVQLADEGRVRGAIEHFYELVPDHHDALPVGSRLLLLLRLAGALTVMPAEGCYPVPTELDDEAEAQLAKELDRVVPRVRKVAADAHKRMNRLSAST